MKYNYDKKLLKSLGVGPFLGQVKLREKMIAEAPDTMPQSIFNANVLAKKLHPGTQYAVITAITEHADAKSFTLAPDAEKGTEQLAYFRAGQYVSIALDIGEAKLNKPYTIRSSQYIPIRSFCNGISPIPLDIQALFIVIKRQKIMIIEFGKEKQSNGTKPYAHQLFEEIIGLRFTVDFRNIITGGIHHHQSKCQQHH